MSNRLAVILGILVVACVAADQYANGGQASLFLIRKFVDLVEWIKFWR